MAKTAFMSGVITVVVLFLSASRSRAEIKTRTLTSDARSMILMEKFVFTGTHHVSISVSSASVVAPRCSSSHPDLSRFGFILLTEEALLQVLIEIQQNPNFCVLDSHYVLRLFTFRSLSSLPSPNLDLPVNISSEYSLFFANCAPKSTVSMSVHTELYNLDNSTTRDYLSAGQTFLPTLFSLFPIIYFSFLFLWLYVSFSKKLSYHWIYFLMVTLLLVKALDFFCAAEEKNYVQIIGNPNSWDAFFSIFDFFYIVLLFTVIILVGTRWIFLHPVVREREMKMLFLIIPLLAVPCLTDVVVYNTEPYTKGWTTLDQIMFYLDLISCFVVVQVFVWRVRSLRKISAGEPGLNSDKVRFIKRFYCTVSRYSFIARFVLFVLFAVRTVFFFLEKQWVNNLVKETISLVFYIVMLRILWLLQEDEFSVIVEEEENLAV